MVGLQCVAHGMVVNCTEFKVFTFTAPISECISNVHTFMCKYFTYTYVRSDPSHVA
jgi:hypothetical protein